MDEKLKAAYISVVSNTILTLSKIGIGISGKSMAVISEGLHSGIDLLASVIAAFAIKKALIPPDKDHQYGHAKYENISGVVEALLITIAGGIIVYEAVHKLIKGSTELHYLDWGIYIMIISVIANIIVSSYLFKVGRKTDSMALMADGWHLRTDVYTSLGVLAGLIVIKYTGLVWLDSVVAILVALWIIWVSFKLLMEAGGGLTDKALPPEEEELIKSIILEHYKFFVEFHKLRTRKAGNERHIDLHLVIKPDTTTEKAHNLCDHLEKEINRKLPNCKILIHVEPEKIVLK